MLVSQKELDSSESWLRVYLVPNNKSCGCDSLDCMMDILGPSIPEFCILAAIPFLRAWRAQSMLETA